MLLLITLFTISFVSSYGQQALVFANVAASSTNPLTATTDLPFGGIIDIGNVAPGAKSIDIWLYKKGDPHKTVSFNIALSAFNYGVKATSRLYTS